MTAFILKAVLVTLLATNAGLFLGSAFSARCAVPRYKQIGHINNGRAIIVFDSCLGFAYAEPVANVDALLKNARPKDQEM